MDKRIGALYPFPLETGFEAKEGMQGDFVMLLQIVLNEIRLFNDRYPPLLVSGIYGKEVSLAVKEVQKLSALPKTGNTDSATWNSIAMQYNLAQKSGQ